MITWNNWYITIRNYEIDKIYVNDNQYKYMELLGTPLWDKINNIQTWLLKYPREFEFTKTMTKYDYQQFIESRGR